MNHLIKLFKLIELGDAFAIRGWLWSRIKSAGKFQYESVKKSKLFKRGRQYKVFYYLLC